MERYGRFGMEQAEARLPTPEHYRESYQELLAAAQTIDRTPSPLPESGELNKGNASTTRIVWEALTRFPQGLRKRSEHKEDELQR